MSFTLDVTLVSPPPWPQKFTKVLKETPVTPHRILICLEGAEALYGASSREHKLPQILQDLLHAKTPNALMRYNSIKGKLAAAID